MAPKRDYSPGLFDVPYGLASTNIAAGATIVVTTGANYHGCSVIAGDTAKAVVRVFDNASATTGKTLDLFTFASNGDVCIDKYIPFLA